jgi:hypothetical protein
MLNIIGAAKKLLSGSARRWLRGKEQPLGGVRLGDLLRVTVGGLWTGQ